MKVNRVSANGVDFAYLERGDESGPLALCLHGFPDHAPTFEPLLESLADAGFHAVAPWMRGYAPTSVAEDGDYRTGALAADAIALADVLAPGKRAVLVGHDWGAGAAYLACAYQPERFSHLVAMALPYGLGAGLLTNFRQMKRSWYIFFFQLPGIPEMAVRAEDFAFIDRLWRDWSPGFEPPAEFMRELKETLASPGSLEAALGYYRAVFRASAGSEAASGAQSAGSRPILAPTLYLHGADDGCIGSEMIKSEAMRGRFTGGSRVEIVSGAGHFLHLEKPELLNRMIVGFLAG